MWLIFFYSILCSIFGLEVIILLKRTLFLIHFIAFFFAGLFALIFLFIPKKNPHLRVTAQIINSATRKSILLCLIGSCNCHRLILKDDDFLYIWIWLWRRRWSPSLMPQWQPSKFSSACPTRISDERRTWPTSARGAQTLLAVRHSEELLHLISRFIPCLCSFLFKQLTFFSFSSSPPSPQVSPIAPSH